MAAGLEPTTLQPSGNRTDHYTFTTLVTLECLCTAIHIMFTAQVQKLVPMSTRF